MTYIEYGILGILGIRMILAGFTGDPGRPLSWPMFAYGGAVRLEAWVQDAGEDAHVVHLSDFAMRGDIVFDALSGHDLVGWLAQTHDHVWGTIWIYDESGLNGTNFDLRCKSR